MAGPVSDRVSSMGDQPVSEVGSGAWMGSDPMEAVMVPSWFAYTCVVSVHWSSTGTGSSEKLDARAGAIV
jgi:hypothetical protein